MPPWNIWPPICRPNCPITTRKILEEHGYTQIQMTPGLWYHTWRPIQFTLIVDDFGVKYIRYEHADHLISVVKKHYELTHDLKKRTKAPYIAD